MKNRRSSAEIPGGRVSRIAKIQENVLMKWPLEESTDEEHTSGRVEKQLEIVWDGLFKEWKSVVGYQKRQQKRKIIPSAIHHTLEASSKNSNSGKYQYVRQDQEINLRKINGVFFISKITLDIGIQKCEPCDHEYGFFDKRSSRNTELMNKKDWYKWRKWDKNQKKTYGNIKNRNTRNTR